MPRLTDTPTSGPSVARSGNRSFRLPWIISHDTLNQMFSALTYFGPVFVLFLSELGLPKTQIGFLLSLLPFCGPLALFVAPAVARAGVKRVFLVCWSGRTAVTALFLLVPWVAPQTGAETTFAVVAALVMAFALLRAVGETAFYPWFQEMVPPAIRGRFSGIRDLFGLLGTGVSLVAASYAIEHVTGIAGYVLVIGAGVVIGFISVLCAFPIPGGAPGRRRYTSHSRALRQALDDRVFRIYLAATGLTILGGYSMVYAFVPLFMKEQVGLPDSDILLLQVVSHCAGLLSCYAWGWAADRYGSKPVVMWAVGLMVLVPLCWWVMPRHHALSFAAGAAIALLWGVFNAGWSVGEQRLFYVDVIPPEKKTEYVAVFYAWMGLLGGLGPIAAGVALDAFDGPSGHWLGLPVGPFTPVFVVGAVLLGTSVLIMSRLKSAMQGEPTRR